MVRKYSNVHRLLSIYNCSPIVGAVNHFSQIESSIFKNFKNINRFFSFLFCNERRPPGHTTRAQGPGRDQVRPR
jgi:hypothetical protein